MGEILDLSSSGRSACSCVYFEHVGSYGLAVILFALLVKLVILHR